VAGQIEFRPSIPNIVRPRFRYICLLPLAGLQLLMPSATQGGETGESVVVYASVNPAYHRPLQPDGSFKIETYAFGEGGLLGGAVRDTTIDKLSFKEIARVIAPALASKKYLPCQRTDPAQTDLLIMVYWGTTVGTVRTSASPEYQIARALTPPPPAPRGAPPNGQGGTAMVSDPSASGRLSEGQTAAAVQAAADSALQQSLLLTSMANRQRDRQDFENASLLGYFPEMKRLEGFEQTPLNRRRQDVVDEVEESRYFVVLMAYDFQMLLQHKQRKLLWETRFSIRESRNDFSRQLAAMAQSASRYFGQDSQGLARKPLGEGRVDFGELKVLGIVPEKK
jgi:hypothetical protein